MLTQYVAHPKNDQGHQQTLREHLDNVANLSSGFAAEFGEEVYARQIGLAHDLGKTRSLWQERILRIEAGEKPKFVELLHDHKMSGAALVYSQDPLAALIIAGHHQGLPDFAKMKAEMESGKWEALRQEVVERVGTLEFPTETQKPISIAYFKLMMLYSCLVDADAIDTSAHAGDRLEVSTTFSTMAELHSKLLAASVPATASAAVQAMRTQVREACLAAIPRERGIFTLHAPTGSGKTISGGLWATGHAEALHGRIAISGGELWVLSIVHERYGSTTGEAFTKSVRTSAEHRLRTSTTCLSRHQQIRWLLLERCVEVHVCAKASSIHLQHEGWGSAHIRRTPAGQQDVSQYVAMPCPP
jgi:CRISPR-associated endonuclease Cas3-HD